MKEIAHKSAVMDTIKIVHSYTNQRQPSFMIFVAFC